MRLRQHLARLFGSGPPPGADRSAGAAAPGGLPLPVAAELESFDRMVQRLGMGSTGPPGDGGAAGESPEDWKPELSAVKAQRHRVLAVVARTPGVTPGRSRELEACLLQGWHLVFHSYAMAAGLLPDDTPEDPRVRREGLRRAYAASLAALTSGRKA